MLHTQRASLLARFFVILLTSLVISPISAQDSEEQLPQVSIPNTQFMTMTAESNGEDYHVYIGLPYDYDFEADKSYPVLYLVGANSAFGTVTPWLQFAGAFADMPEIFVVGIDVVPMSLWGTAPSLVVDGDVMEDLSRNVFPPLPNQEDLDGRQKLLTFINEQLAPYIDENYRTMADDRSLAGGSAYGSFVTWALFENPTAFDRYLIVSPAAVEVIVNDEAFANFEAMGGADATITLYVVVGDMGFENNFRFAINDMLEAFEERGYENLTIYSEFIDDARHADIGAAGMIRGLRYIYCRNPKGAICVLNQP